MQKFATFLAVCALAASAACESSSSVTSAPTPARCPVEAQASSASFPATGGTGTLRITTNRECAWSLTTSAAWISLPTPAQRQGEAVLEFSVASHSDPGTRTADIVVQEQRLQVSQEGRACEFRVSSTSELVDASGGERRVEVIASSPQCQWTAATNESWITLVAGGATSGSGAVLFQVSPMSGVPRSGAVTVAGQVVRVEQGGGCAYAVAPSSLQFGSAGGGAEVAVTTEAGCTWSAAAGAEWISVTGSPARAGGGVVGLTASATSGPPRSAVVTIAGHEVVVQQGSGCAVGVSPGTAGVPAAGGGVSVQVDSDAGCVWSVSPGVPWISVSSGAAGTGPARVDLQVAANAGPARTASVSIGSGAISIQQATGCSVSVSPGSTTVAAAGGSVPVQVQTAAGCAWSAASASPWITIASGPTGSGVARVDLVVAANVGPARTGSVTVGGAAVSVAQASGCTYAVAPPTHDVAAAGAAGTVSLTTAAGCTWSAASAVNWITVTPQGTGPGPVQFSAAPNMTPSRTGTFSLAGRLVTVNQPSVCSFLLAPPSHSFPAGGGAGNVLVIVSGPCTWTAVSAAEWIVMTAGHAGTGNGLVQFSVPPNSGAARTGTVTIAGQKYVVTQEGQ